MRRDLRDFRWRAGLTELNLRGRYRFEKLDPWIMIDALRAGRYLPDQLIEQLPICWVLKARHTLVSMTVTVAALAEYLRLAYVSPG
jgi:hypothetical protein